jgi:SAM-dependent methyltransferase
MLPIEDRTPAGYALPQTTLAEWMVKRPVRRFVYPLYNRVVDRWLRNRYRSLSPFPVDRWLWGQRGNDFESHRRGINRLLSLRRRTVMIAGCGTGRDILSWLPYEPDRIIGVDYFRYDTAWHQLRKHAHDRYPSTRLDFQQGELTRLDTIADATVDVVGSDAVFEHIRDLPAVSRELWRVLRPGGLLYATFGPLWYCWGGDHVSGYDGIANGYNHLLFGEKDYAAYLSAAGPHEHSEHDGRTWIENDLFSRLRPAEYLSIIHTQGFERRYVAAIIDPRAVQCLSLNPDAGRTLRARHQEMDLIVTGMTIIYQKSAAK